MAEQFIKKVDETGKIPGDVKCAILLSEIGSIVSEPVLAKLNPDEKSKILKGFKKIGTKYDSNNSVQVSRELLVLNELKDYGMRKGIYKDVSVKSSDNKKAKENKLSSVDAEAMASVISSWLKS